LRRLGAPFRRAGLTALLHGESADHGGEKQQRHDAGEHHAQSAARPGLPGAGLGLLGTRSCLPVGALALLPQFAIGRRAARRKELLFDGVEVAGVLARPIQGAGQPGSPI
jgi:hypothetical protein